MKDYDFAFQYHPSKENVVADALSRKPYGIFAYLDLEDQKRMVIIGDYNLQYYKDDCTTCLYNIVPTLFQQMQQSQWQDEELSNIQNQLSSNEELEGWKTNVDGFLLFNGKLIVTNNPSLREVVLHKAHKSKFAVHPGSTKMYHNLNRQYWWKRMKRDVISFFLSACLANK